jgi:hypothetical protein
VQHCAHKVTATCAGPAGDVDFGFATCVMRSDAASLRFECRAPSEEGCGAHSSSSATICAASPIRKRLLSNRRSAAADAVAAETDALERALGPHTSLGYILR